ncbi:hypothetical protein NADFUDRAFT_51651 [Nadsonia fulvescens var. elongata DSM 6958]|uniref:WD40 repeat-like protein n=1 Tax=Nadsonia fulvescens var. elongata DSM 6958 TaxID=857566 RepID=A0A1E3PJE5_9ASCO|nr:hypothetical protein NADFUDRAFT_51651 [Nadsonia fulvescens var. elongata DSM 6958]
MPPRKSTRAKRINYSTANKSTEFSDDDTDMVDKTAGHSDSEDEFVVDAVVATGTNGDKEMAEDEDEDENEETNSTRMDLDEDDEIEVIKPSTKVSRVIKPKKKIIKELGPEELDDDDVSVSDSIISSDNKLLPRYHANNTQSLYHRFILYYGSNSKGIVEAVENRQKFAHDNFILHDDTLDTFAFENTLTEDSSGSSVYKVSHNDHEFLKHYMLNDSRVHINAADKGNQISLERFEISPLSTFVNDILLNKQGYIINAGDPITSMAWSSSILGDDQYLAVATISGGILPTSEQISGFNNRAFSSSIQIYKIDFSKKDSNEGAAKLVQIIGFEWGNAWDLEWKPGNSGDNGYLGSLAAVFQDGKARLFDVIIESDENRYTSLIKPTLVMSLDDSKITCLTFRTEDYVSVGTYDGYIAEFYCGSDQPEDHGDDENGSAPVYHYPLFSSYITSITSARPKRPNLLYANSTEGCGRLVDIRDIKRAISLSARNFSAHTFSKYIPMLDSFLTYEDPDTSKALPIRKTDIILLGTSLTKHDGTMTSMDASIRHPFVLTGGSDGTLRMGNALRRATINKRQANTIYNYLTLWQLDYSDKNNTPGGIYRLSEMNRAEKLSKPNTYVRAIIYPPQVIVSSVCWNQTLIGGGWYAAATHAGIIRIEKVSI